MLSLTLARSAAHARTSVAAGALLLSALPLLSTLPLLSSCAAASRPNELPLTAATPEPAAQPQVPSRAPSNPEPARLLATEADDVETSTAASAQRGSEPLDRESPAVLPEANALGLPAGTTVLHVGDSFAGALGLDLSDELRSSGVRSILKYKTASYIPTWAWGHELAEYISRFQPDLVLVTLGANELQIPDPSVRVRAITQIVHTIGSRPCVWVGPPLWPGARSALLDVIREHCAPCAYMDSTALLPDLPRARDGIHPAAAARAGWAKVVVQWLKEHRTPTVEQPWTLSSSSPQVP